MEITYYSRNLTKRQCACPDNINAVNQMSTRVGNMSVFFSVLQILLELKRTHFFTDKAAINLKAAGCACLGARLNPVFNRPWMLIMILCLLTYVDDL